MSDAPLRLPGKSSTASRRLPAAKDWESLFVLWHRLAAFPAAQSDAALRHLQEWLARAIDADNVIWIGAVRVLHGAAAQKDPFLGWRLRTRQALRPDPEAYRRILPSYYNSDHYGKLTPTYYLRSHEAKQDSHVGLTGRASLVGAGRFRVHRLRDADWIDFAAFKRSAHYRLYYHHAIVDRMTIGFPVSAGVESFFLIDRHHRKTGPRRRPFTRREAAVAGTAVRGVPALHRQLILSHGLFTGDKLLSPTELQILRGLLTGLTEKELAVRTGQKPATLHKYVTALYKRFGVTSRPALMALWLGDRPC